MSDDHKATLKLLDEFRRLHKRIEYLEMGYVQLSRMIAGAGGFNELAQWLGFLGELRDEIRLRMGAAHHDDDNPTP